MTLNISSTAQLKYVRGNKTFETVDEDKELLLMFLVFLMCR